MSDLNIFLSFYGLTEADFTGAILIAKTDCNKNRTMHATYYLILLTLDPQLASAASR